MVTTDQVNMKINDRLVTASPGETIYTAAQNAGIAVPSLCASAHLASFGSCRLCLCEVEGLPGTPEFRDYPKRRPSSFFAALSCMSGRT